MSLFKLYRNLLENWPETKRGSYFAVRRMWAWKLHFNRFSRAESIKLGQLKVTKSLFL